VTVVADEAAGSARLALWALSAGFFLHGTGHYLAGDRKVAYTLLGTEVAGLLLLSAGWLSQTFASDSAEVVPYSRPVMALGAAAFVGSWTLDLLGTFTGRAGTPRYEPVPPLPIEGVVYYTLWSDPRQGHLNVFTLGLKLPGGRLTRWLDRFTLGFGGAWDPFTDTERPLQTSGWLELRLLGAAGELGSRLSLAGEWTEEYRLDHGYGVSTPAASLEGRLNLEQLFPRFRSVVIHLRWGYGLEATHYEVAGQERVSWSLDGDRKRVTLGEMGMSLPLMRAGRVDLRWRLLNERLLSVGYPGRAEYHLGFLFHISNQMDLHVSLNNGTGFDGWIGVGYRYY